MASDSVPIPTVNKILCVDDDDAIRDVLVLALRPYARVIETAANGLEAWERLSAGVSDVDLVITDNQMPELSGLELVQLLRESNYPGKVVFFSSTVGPKDADEIARLRVDAVIEKGCGLGDLLATISGVLRR